jgi:hypothetical protein
MLEATEMKDEFSRAIREALNGDATLVDLIAVLRTFKNAGLAQETAYEVLESLRQLVSETAEDRLLELEDVVCGFCAAEHRLW